MNSNNPIGIFDSGIGGLTVAHAIVNLLPNENIIYFGDTAHMPYGDKSAEAIQGYAVKVAELLLKQQCKLILIACNSASAAAYQLVKDTVGDKAIVLNVIDPMIAHLKNHANKHVGLIGTRQTVNSNIYQQHIAEQNIGIELTAHATNLLASAIEEFGDSPVIDSLLDVYLNHPNLRSCDALVLACTHYPLIKRRIQQYYEHKIEIIDSADIAALMVQQTLDQHNLLNNDGKGSKHFYVSDFTTSFADNAKQFFGDDVTLEHYPLWD